MFDERVFDEKSCTEQTSDTQKVGKKQKYLLTNTLRSAAMKRIASRVPTEEN